MQGGLAEQRASEIKTHIYVLKKHHALKVSVLFILPLVYFDYRIELLTHYDQSQVYLYLKSCLQYVLRNS